jgi:methane/ammonia monooxygenase subunit C
MTRGVVAQIVTRYSNLTDVVWNGQSKVILNNRTVP